MGRGDVWALFLARRSAVPNWTPGDTIPLGGNRSLRVVEVRPGLEQDSDPVLVVEAA